MNKDMILILDFGGNQAQAMARMLRNAGVYCEVLPYSVPIEQINKENPQGIIMAGGRDDRDLECAYEVYLIRTPVLALGASARHMLKQLGGRVLETHIADSMVYLEADTSCPLFDGVSDCERPVKRIHAVELPETFRTVAQTEGITAAFAYERKRLFALQYDIEINDPEGLTILNNFLNDICCCERWWSIPAFIEAKVQEIREQVGDRHALMALSGGVDSSVSAALMHHAIGDKLHCVYVDTGLMRKGDTERIKRVFREQLGIGVTLVDAKKRFLNKLRGITDPKEKWRVVSEEFAEVYTEVALELHSFDFLVEGTIYSDVLRGYDLGYTLPINGETVLSDKVMIEPVRDLFKDEVRAVGEVLGLPHEIIRGQSFPGAGLGIRIIGEVTDENLHLLREADAIWHEEIVAAGLDKRIRRYFAVLTETTSTGRIRCEHVISLCALGNSGIDYTAYRMPYDLLERVTARILRALPKVDRVTYDMTTTPPRPVEWE